MYAEKLMPRAAASGLSVLLKSWAPLRGDVLRRLLADIEQRHPSLRGIVLLRRYFTLLEQTTMATLWHFPQKDHVGSF
jgi:hypothetical protein